MDFFDYLAIEFVARKTNLDRDVVKRIFYAGKPWLDNEYFNRLMNEAQELKINPMSALDVHRAIEMNEAVRILEELDSGKAMKDIQGISEEQKRIVRQRDHLLRESQESEETISIVSDCLYGYAKLIILDVLERRR